MEDKVIYTDGRDVTVTDSTLKVKNTAYKINGITRFTLWTIRPDRWPGVLLMLLGVAALLCGWLGLVPAEMSMQTENGVVSSNVLALWIGGALFVLGLLVLALTKERYAVRIATAEGEKNALVSHKREYVAQVVDALHKAFSFGPDSGYTPTTGSSYVGDHPNDLRRI
jgi:hypothetical protein